MPHKVSNNMDYIQKLFLGIQAHIQEKTDLDQLIFFLDREPPEFRSIAYESASMELGLIDLMHGSALEHWKKFYDRSRHAHPFHIEIGLGWAFAKHKIFPSENWMFPKKTMPWMIIDGIGYYYGLFRGRRTVKHQLVPEEINERQRHGFDQGLGRRLWYISKGEVKKLNALIQSFPVSRQADLWRGVGIACGYVGGCNRSDLESLVDTSKNCYAQLSIGIALAIISRIASGSVTKEVEMACNIVCKMTVAEMDDFKNKIIDGYITNTAYKIWIAQLEMKITQKFKMTNI